VIGLAGAFSYGIFLIHHPYVIWLGLRIRELPIWIFLVVTVAVLAMLTLWGILLEKATNGLVFSLIRRCTGAGK
jgi:hypothetical protein